MHIYAVGLSATLTQKGKYCPSFGFAVSAAVAENEDQAIEMGLREALNVFPVDDGYCDHTCKAVQSPDHLITLEPTTVNERG